MLFVGPGPGRNFWQCRRVLGSNEGSRRCDIGESKEMDQVQVHVLWRFLGCRVLLKLSLLESRKVALAIPSLRLQG
jgi:hypothetical protein